MPNPFFSFIHHHSCSIYSSRTSQLFFLPAGQLLSRTSQTLFFSLWSSSFTFSHEPSFLFTATASVSVLLLPTATWLCSVLLSLLHACSRSAEDGYYLPKLPAPYLRDPHVRFFFLHLLCRRVPARTYHPTTVSRLQTQLLLKVLHDYEFQPVTQ